MKIFIYLILNAILLSSFGAIAASLFIAIWLNYWLALKIFTTGVLANAFVLVVHKFIKWLSKTSKEASKQALKELAKESPEKVSKFQERLAETMRKQSEN